MTIYFVSLTVRWSLQAIYIIYTSFLASRIFLDWIMYLFWGSTCRKIIRNASDRRIELCSVLTCIRKCHFNDGKNWTSHSMFFYLVYYKFPLNTFLKIQSNNVEIFQEYIPFPMHFSLLCKTFISNKNFL